MRYKGLLLDYDGTAVTRTFGSKRVMMSVMVKRAIKGIKGEVKVGFCTGKQFQDIYKHVEELGVDGPHICCGGSQIVARGGRVVWERLIEDRIAKGVFEVWNEKGKMVVVKQDKYQYVGQKFREKMERIYGRQFILRRVESLKSWSVPQMVVYDLTDEELGELEKMGVYVARQRRPGATLWYADVTAKGVNKQAAVLRWRKLLGLKREEVVAVGDGYNDYPLLMACGVKVAMGNAVEELKEIADFVAPSVKEDGVAAVVEKFFSE